MQKPSLSREWVFLQEFMDLEVATGEPDAKWEGWQYLMLNAAGNLQISTKARQIGWSWLQAAKAVARRIMYPRSTSIFVSINLNESKEKIRYANHIIEALHPSVRPILTLDNQTELEFNNGSRLISHPARPARGKAKADIVLDEWAFYPAGQNIYASTLPVIARGGDMMGGSTPMGEGGTFWEIAKQELKPYKGFIRFVIPWWVSSQFCNDLADAAVNAPSMETEERVETYGTERLQLIYDNVPLDSFQQEFECLFIDESVAWITWDEIKRNQARALEGQHLIYSAKMIIGRGMDQATAMIDRLATAIDQGRAEKVLTAGYDVGRNKHLSELIICGNDTNGNIPVRLMISLDRVEFDDQEAILRYALDNLPIKQMLIDRNGLGMQLAENMGKSHKQQAQGVDFTMQSKQLWSTEIKMRLQKNQVPLPIDRNLAYQIHSIKRKITAAKNVVYDTESNEKHHADKYWALVLAIWAARGKPKKTPRIIGMQD